LFKDKLRFQLLIKKKMIGWRLKPIMLIIILGSFTNLMKKEKMKKGRFIPGDQEKWAN